MSRPANKLLAKKVFNDSKISSEEHSENEYDTPIKEHTEESIKRQRSTDSFESDLGGDSPIIKRRKGETIQKSRSIWKSSPSEKPKSGFKMFKTFEKDESSDEEENNHFSFGHTPTKSASKKNPLSKWLNSNKTEVEDNNFNCDRENVDANKRKDTMKVKDHSIRKENPKLRDSSSKKKSSFFSDCSDDEDIKVVDNMSLEPLDNSYLEDVKKHDLENNTSINTAMVKLKFQLRDSENSGNKVEFNFDKKLKNATSNGVKASKVNVRANDPIVISILKKGSSSSTSSIEIIEEKRFKFPAHLKTPSKQKSLGKKANNGSEVLLSSSSPSSPDCHEQSSKPSKDAEKRKRGDKCQSKGLNQKSGSSIFDYSDDSEVTKNEKKGLSAFDDDNDLRVQKCGSSIFEYEDPPDVVKIIERESKNAKDASKSGFKKHAKRRQSLAKMAKRSIAKGGKSETESEEKSMKKPVKPKRRKKTDSDENQTKKQKSIRNYFKPQPTSELEDNISSETGKASPETGNASISSPIIKDSDEDSDEELNDEYIPDLDELLKMPERPADGAKTMDEILDEVDKQIAERQRAHEEEMEKLDNDIETEKRKRIVKKARMKENAKRRNKLETQLTERKLRKLFKRNLEYLQAIWDGKVESSRHKAFHQSIRARHALYYTMITHPFTDEQLDWTLDEIEKVWMRTKEEYRQNNEYVWKVLLAECFVKFYMDFFGVSKDEAVKMISETPLHKKDRLKEMKVSDESENSDSN